MAGAEFVRADLHVHTFKDLDEAPAPDVDAYIATAVERGLSVLAITDHNTSRFARAAVAAAKGKPILVLPGVEISTHDGHLLGIFAPGDVDQLEALTNPTELKLTTVSPTEQRSTRSMLDLVEDIDTRGGLAIPAHVDASDGLGGRLKPAELEELLCHPGLAGLEFATPLALAEWFTDRDPDPNRLAAWKARQRNEALKERGLARLASSDAHSLDKVGQDRSLRTLTRLRLDDPNFEAVRNAIKLNAKARCKAEADLPVTYPRLVKAEFRGGFLDGVTLEFSANLNCLIGGRGSGKSTALLALRAALGRAPDANGDDPDAADRMPDETEVHFIDAAGSPRTALRRRGEIPIEPDSGSPIRLRLAELGQDESGAVARAYEAAPEVLLRFLDNFVVRHQYDEREAELISQLGEVAAEVQRTSVHADEVKKFEAEHAQLDASLRAAQKGQVEKVAEWAGLLAAQAPLLARLEQQLAALETLGPQPAAVDLDRLAADFGVDLTQRPKRFVESPDGFKERLRQFERRRSEIQAEAVTALREASAPAKVALDLWLADQSDLLKRLDAKQKDLEAQGLTVQAGAVRRIADRLNSVKGTLNQLHAKREAHDTARKARADLLRDLHANRDALFEARRATMKRIVAAANEYSDGLTIHVGFDRCGLRLPWARWLSSHFGFRAPRVHRLAERLRPDEFAVRILSDVPGLLALKDDSGEPFFTEEALTGQRTWANLFELETMLIEDRPRIAVQEVGSTERRALNALSAGQQRSVLLSLLLCAERNEPLIVDQPEDHLDARYIASAVVGHLERAKERRQVIIATHSPNLTVLGDAELVIPLRVENGHGRPYDEGAVDRPATREQVCGLLEGGVEAYEKRGERYGFRFSSRPPAPDAGTTSQSSGKN